MNKFITEYINTLKEQINNKFLNIKNELNSAVLKEDINLNDTNDFNQFNSELNKIGLQIKEFKEKEKTFSIKINKLD